MSIFAGTTGALDDIPASDVGRFETELLDYMRTRKADIMTTIREKGSLPDGDAMAESVAAFKASFVATTSGEST